MSWVTFIWALTIGACATMALPHLVIGLRRHARENLFFALAALSVAGIAWGELGIMRSLSTEEIARMQRWTHVPVFFTVLGVTGFVHFYFGTGRWWLGCCVVAMRFLGLILNFISPANLNYREVTSLRHLSFLGETVVMPEGILNPWMRVGELSSLLLLAYVIDASIKRWRRGTPENRRRAAMVGGSIAIFLLVAAGLSALIHARALSIPYLISFPFLGVIVAMGFELSSDIVRAAHTTHQLSISEKALRESEERMLLATEAAQLGMWMWDIHRNTFWLSDKLRELFGYSAAEGVTYDSFLKRVHEADRPNVAKAIQRALDECTHYHWEYRVICADASLLWLADTGRVKCDPTGAPVMMLGVSMDVTEQRRVQDDARTVSGKLITAQEDERKRIARDLHDDLNQRLAMLSVQMDIFSADTQDTSGPARERLESMSSQVKALSSEVHRLSYQLHPAKLDQLGLVAAARTICREVSAQSGIAVRFEQEEVPRDINADVALCLYRVIQEALQNSVRHSGGAPIQVKLTCTGERIELRIADEGKGFDVNHAMHNGGLGLVSMRERVRQVDGAIRFDSSPGKGTRIEVMVPLLRQVSG